MFFFPPSKCRKNIITTITKRVQIIIIIIIALAQHRQPMKQVAHSYLNFFCCYCCIFAPCKCREYYKLTFLFWRERWQKLTPFSTFCVVCCCRTRQCQRRGCQWWWRHQPIADSAKYTHGKWWPTTPCATFASEKVLTTFVVFLVYNGCFLFFYSKFDKLQKKVLALPTLTAQVKTNQFRRLPAKVLQANRKSNRKRLKLEPKSQHWSTMCNPFILAALKIQKVSLAS